MLIEFKKNGKVLKTKRIETEKGYSLDRCLVHKKLLEMPPAPHRKCVKMKKFFLALDIPFPDQR